MFLRETVVSEDTEKIDLRNKAWILRYLHKCH
jgi:hypothetical protein